MSRERYRNVRRPWSGPHRTPSPWGLQLEPSGLVDVVVGATVVVGGIVVVAGVVVVVVVVVLVVVVVVVLVVVVGWVQQVTKSGPLIKHGSPWHMVSALAVLNLIIVS